MGFGLHPRFEIVAGEFERADAGENIREQRQFAGAVAEIARDGVCDFILVIDQQADQAVEPVNSFISSMGHGSGRPVFALAANYACRGWVLAFYGPPFVCEIRPETF
jgi:hypothetical protein